MWGLYPQNPPCHVHVIVMPVPSSLTCSNTCALFISDGVAVDLDTPGDSCNCQRRKQKQVNDTSLLCTNTKAGCGLRQTKWMDHLHSGVSCVRNLASSGHGGQLFHCCRSMAIAVRWVSWNVVPSKRHSTEDSFSFVI